MGRSFESVRQGVKGPIDRWARAARALRKEDQPYGERLVALAKLHSSEAFYGCDDPLEAVVFSVLVEMSRQQDGEARERDRKESEDTHNVDP
ncbi:MAG: hypothetical protein WCJ47_10470 [Methanomicrobiales archaeon]